ncbi:fused MFS/spermidine synthase [Spiractinospora alimapuensis]|uniref:spermidine synthase n=1 Tax=Spiractinospora alimapuensis TaxID=2820884 RepID=UPI001F38203A|nr:fused MFS/spermidine synthase [Spiractinospora alimapuensis]QVQ53666.1 fused MFS/spermidine synthase [Spiractinospora alimapuensis]
MPSSAAGSTADQTPRVEVLRDLDGGANSWLLMVEGVPQSHVDLDDPTRIDFEYVRRLAHVVDLLAPAGEPVDAFHLGAGALTLARYVAATRPASRQRAVDIDGDLVDQVRARLPWDPRARIRVGVGEARAWLEQRREASADLVVTDVYAGARAPANVTTVEFVAVASNVLRPDGIYAVNVGDGGSLAHVRRQIATLREVFDPDNLAAIAEPAVWRGRRFGNFVLLASHRPLPIDELSRRAHRDPDMARLVSGRKLHRFAAVARPARDATAEDSPLPPRDVFSR